MPAAGVDSNIPLQANAPQIDLASIISNGLQIKQMQQQMQTQNSLKAILQQPDALDKSGAPTANTLAQIARLGPQGLQLSSKLMDQQSLAEQRTVDAKYKTSQTQVEEGKAAQDALNSALKIHDGEVGDGNVAPEIAEKNLKDSLHDYVFSQPWSDARKANNWAALDGLSPAQLRKAAASMAVSDAQAQHEQELTEKRTPATMDGKPVEIDEAGNVYGPNGGDRIPVTAPIVRQEPGFNPDAAAAREEAARQAAADRAENAKPTLENDPVSGQQYWAFPPTKDGPPRYETLDGKTYAPQGAAHIASGAVRGGIAGAIMAAQSENQREGRGPLSSDQIEQISADYTRKTKAAASFGTGKQGDQVRFLNVAMDHLATLKDAAAALKNGDIKRFNAISQQIAEETGSPVPTNFDAVRQIVSQEVHKGVAGVGGSAEERDNLSQNVSRSSSPEQLAGAIDKVDKLLAGQADGLRRQYEESTGLDNFGDMLSPSARALLKDHPDEGSRHGGGVPAPPITATGPSGRKIVLTNGKWVDAKTGAPL